LAFVLAVLVKAGFSVVLLFSDELGFALRLIEFNLLVLKVSDFLGGEPSVIDCAAVPGFWCFWLLIFSRVVALAIKLNHSSRF